MRATVIDWSRMKGWLRVLTTPGCWIQLNPYSPEWEHDLRKLMAEHRFTEIRECTTMLGPLSIWIENHPYSSFRPYKSFEYDDRVRPRRITVLEAMDKLERDRPMTQKTTWREYIRTETGSDA